MLAVTSMYQSGFLSVTRWFEMTDKTQDLVSIWRDLISSAKRKYGWWEC